jgi:hypothetical protein
VGIASVGYHEGVTTVTRNVSASLVAVELGHVNPGDRRTPSDVTGRLCYLHDLRAVVAVEQREQTSWRCRVLARRHTSPGPTHVTITHAELLAAPTALTVDADADPDTFGMLWHIQARHRSQNETEHTIIRRLAEHLRPPQRLTIDLNPAAVARLATSTEWNETDVWVLVQRLTDAGLLAPPAGLNKRGNVYALTLPDPQPTGPLGRQPAHQPGGQKPARHSGLARQGQVVAMTDSHNNDTGPPHRAADPDRPAIRPSTTPP